MREQFSVSKQDTWALTFEESAFLTGDWLSSFSMVAALISIQLIVFQASGSAFDLSLFAAGIIVGRSIGGTVYRRRLTQIDPGSILARSQLQIAVLTATTPLTVQATQFFREALFGTAILLGMATISKVLAEPAAKKRLQELRVEPSRPYNGSIAIVMPQIAGALFVGFSSILIQSDWNLLLTSAGFVLASASFSNLRGLPISSQDTDPKLVTSRPTSREVIAEIVNSPYLQAFAIVTVLIGLSVAVISSLKLWLVYEMFSGGAMAFSLTIVASRLGLSLVQSFIASPERAYSFSTVYCVTIGALGILLVGLSISPNLTVALILIWLIASLSSFIDVGRNCLWRFGVSYDCCESIAKFLHNIFFWSIGVGSLGAGLLIDRGISISTILSTCGIAIIVITVMLYVVGINYRRDFEFLDRHIPFSPIDETDEYLSANEDPVPENEERLPL